MVDFLSLLELAQIKAIHLAIEPSLDSIWRIKCRDYSERFHTPLHVVMNELPASMVLEALYESKYSPSIVDDELEELYEILSKIKDPNYSRMSKEETEELVDSVLNKEIARTAKKKAPTQETIKAAIRAEEIKPHNPKSGSMNFSELEQLESSSESENGFKD